MILVFKNFSGTVSFQYAGNAILSCCYPFVKLVNIRLRKNFRRMRVKPLLKIKRQMFNKKHG